jgi:hypothetical protein
MSQAEGKKELGDAIKPAGFFRSVLIKNSKFLFRAFVFWLSIIYVLIIWPSVLDAPRGGLTVLVVIFFWPILLIEVVVRFYVKRLSGN